MKWPGNVGVLFLFDDLFDQLIAWYISYEGITCVHAFLYPSSPQQGSSQKEWGTRKQGRGAKIRNGIGPSSASLSSQNANFRPSCDGITPAVMPNRPGTTPLSNLGLHFGLNYTPVKFWHWRSDRIPYIVAPNFWPPCSDHTHFWTHPSCWS